MEDVVQESKMPTLQINYLAFEHMFFYNVAVSRLSDQILSVYCSHSGT